jgi:tetratricopeptide (TPR) repeat protein
MIRSTFLRVSLFTFVIACAVAAALAQDSRMPAGFQLQINGQVRYATNNQPAENVLVRCDSFSGGMAGQVVTDRSGRFTFTGLQPQQYVVSTRIPGFVEFSQTVNLVTQNTDYVNVRLVADKNSLINIPNGSLTTPSLNVVDANIPTAAQEEFSKGKLLIDAGDKAKITEGTQHLEKAVELHPAYLEAQLMLGLAYMDLQEWKKAEKPLAAAISLNSAATTAYVALGEVYRREKKYPEGEKTLLDGIAINATSAEAHLTLAKIYLDMAPGVKTEEQFRSTMDNSWKEVNKALASNQSMAEAHLVAGNLLLKARRPEEALKHYEGCLCGRHDQCRAEDKAGTCTNEQALR